VKDGKLASLARPFLEGGGDPRAAYARRIGSVSAFAGALAAALGTNGCGTFAEKE